MPPALRLPLSLREGEGFHLSPIAPGDQPALMEQLLDPSVSLAVPAIPFPYPRARADAWIAHREKRDATLGHHECFAIRDDQGVLHGCIGVDDARDASTTRILGYWLGLGMRGRGLMRAALAAFMPYCKAELGATCLVAHVQTWNEASMRVLMTNGFIRGARLEEHVKTRTGLHDAWVFRREL